QVEYFAHLWNIHSIRNQKNRPYLIPGKPVLNYFHPHHRNPDVRFCGKKCDPAVLQTLRQSIAGYGR
ncbi:hypothetical protein BDD12DRAFT_742789, partial [Trichophaea hybrida]